MPLLRRFTYSPSLTSPTPTINSGAAKCIRAVSDAPDVKTVARLLINMFQSFSVRTDLISLILLPLPNEAAISIWKRSKTMMR